jgi:hypothetical protein
MILGKHNNVQLLWVPGHKENEGNENADHLTRRGSLHPFHLHLKRPSGTGCEESTSYIGSPSQGEDMQIVSLRSSLLKELLSF